MKGEGATPAPQEQGEWPERKHSGLHSGYPTFSLLPARRPTLAPGVFPQPPPPPPTPTPAAGQDSSNLPGAPQPAGLAESGGAAPGGGSWALRRSEKGAGHTGRGREGANQRARLRPGGDWPAQRAPTSPASLCALSHCIP